MTAAHGPNGGPLERAASEPFLATSDFTLYVGDVRDVLSTLEPSSIDCCITSPPYWGLRDYGTGQWEGGDPDCPHTVRLDPKTASSTLRGGKATTGHQREGYAVECARCHARRVDSQLGLEPTPEEYVANMVAVFREVRRVLADHGTCWLNLGDSYNAGREGGHAGGAKQASLKRHEGITRSGANAPGLKPKDLVGIPWRVAFALQADGWYLRSDIIWAKPNPMPESVTDRPTKSHEYVFLLSKQPRYFFDQEAVREKYQESSIARDAYGYNHAFGNQFKGSPTDERHPDGKQLPPGSFAKGPDGRKVTKVVGSDGSLQHRDGERWPNGGRNIRTVWEIATQPYAEAHFATYPEKLVERCLLAGCPEWVCGTCGKAKGTAEIVRTPLGTGPSVDPTPLTGRKGMNRERRDDEGVREMTRGEQIDYAQQIRESTHRDEMAAEAGSAFAHYIRTDESGARPVPPVLLATWLDRGWLTAAESLTEGDCGHNTYRPGIVLDPFMGSGTTALVARKHGRRAVGVELNPEYAELAARRNQQMTIFA